MKSKFKPFPVGTIRGPYLSGSDLRPMVQYAVQGTNGWLYFDRPLRYAQECRQLAEEYSKKILNEVNLIKGCQALWDKTNGLMLSFN